MRILSLVFLILLMAVHAIIWADSITVEGDVSGEWNADMVFVINHISNPNPTCGITEIRYYQTYNKHVKMVLIDINGRTIKTLVDKVQKTGNHAVQFDASTLPAGIYLYRLTTADHRKEGKIIITSN